MFFARFTAAIRRCDVVLIGATVLLVLIGLAALFSITLNVEQPRIEKFFRQVVSFGIGAILLFLAMMVDYRLFRTYSWVFYGIGLVSLVGVLIVGVTLRGTTGWYSFLGSTFQPVELMKVILVIALARYLADHGAEGPSWRLILRTAFLLVLPFLLVLLQPDLGSALILAATWLGMLVFFRLPLRRLGLIVLVVVVTAAISWFVLRDYQRERVLTFLDPGRDPLRSGYNLRQSILAVGSGKLLGRGLGLGTQSQLNFLPTQDTDFIFAVIAEELGFVGVVVLLSLFGTFLLRMVRTVNTTGDAFGNFFLAGIFVLFASEVILNISGNVGLLPITGTPLPFLSYGGSSLISSLFAVGIAESVIARSATR